METICHKCKHYKEHLPQYKGNCFINQKVQIFAFDHEIEIIVVKCRKFEPK